MKQLADIGGPFGQFIASLSGKNSTIHDNEGN